MLTNLRHALRALLRHRGATAFGILSIALGIGITTALFAVADALVFRPCPFVRPGEIHTVNSLGDDQRIIGYGWRDFEDMDRAARGLVELAAYQRVGSVLAGDADTEIVSTYIATPNFLSLLGTPAALGQASLTPAPGRYPPAVLGYRLWTRRFGADPAIIGRTILLNSRPFTVTAVMPPAFTGLVRGVPCDVWIGTDDWLGTSDGRRERNSRNYQYEMIARLPPGTAPAGLAARLDAAIRGADAHKPAPAGATGTWLQPFAFTWQQKLIVSGGLLPLFGLLLLVACANAAQLRLAQTEARRKELGIRLALGSSAWGIARLLMVETLLVSAAGAAGGLLLADTALDLIAAAISAVSPDPNHSLRAE